MRSLGLGLDPLSGWQRTLRCEKTPQVCIVNDTSLNAQNSTRWGKSDIPRYVSIKISASDVESADEVGYMKLISSANPSHEGLSYIRTLIDVFDLQGEGVTHTCLVFEPMRETLYQFQRRLPRQRLGLPISKAYVFCLLHALDYFHTECRLIHTGASLIHAGLDPCR